MHSPIEGKIEFFVMLQINLIPVACQPCKFGQFGV